MASEQQNQQVEEERVVLGYFSRERNMDVCSLCFEKMSGTAQDIFLSTVGCVPFHSSEERGFSLSSVQCDLCQVQFAPEEEDDPEEAAEMEGIKSVQQLEATRASLIISLCHTSLSNEDIAQAAYPFPPSKLGSENTPSELLEECVRGGCDRARVEAILAELEQRSRHVSSNNNNNNNSSRRPKHIKTICTFFARDGDCRNGEGCRFSHDLSLMGVLQAPAPMIHASAYHNGGRPRGNVIGGMIHASAYHNAGRFGGNGGRFGGGPRVMGGRMQIPVGWGIQAPAPYPYPSPYHF